MPDAPPEPLLVERRVETGDDAYIDRVTADGGMWTGGNVTAELADGEWSFDHSASGWQRRATLSPTALAALRQAIEGSGIFEAAAEHHPDVTVIHASREVWTVDLDGRRCTVTVHARGVTQVAAASALGAALEEALASTDEG